MKHYYQIAKDYIAAHKKAFTIGYQIAIGVAVLAIVAGLIAYNYVPRIVYKPTNACAMLTPNVALDLLGDKIKGINSQGTVVDGDIATSRCSYSDKNLSNMKVVALALRSGVNDDGVAQNKAEFFKGKPTIGVTDVKDLGDSAYFNAALGQLNILKGKQWLLISYGVGTDPQSNTLADTTTVAHKVLK